MVAARAAAYVTNMCKALDKSIDIADECISSKDAGKKSGDFVAPTVAIRTEDQGNDALAEKTLMTAPAAKKNGFRLLVARTILWLRDLIPNGGLIALRCVMRRTVEMRCEGNCRAA